MTELTSVGEAETGHSRAAGIARGAGVIAGITMLARILGLIRTLAFSQTVGATCLGSAYFTASQVPDLVAELVLGGALGSAMVPVLARSAERSFTDPGEKAHVSQITSALLTWTMVILIPLTLTIGLAAGPISALLTPANPSAQCVHAELVSTTASMLRVFAPQAFLYGLTIVFFGLLQAYRRFAAYALAPLVASLVLISSYLTFAVLGRDSTLASLSLPMQLVLSGGATLGVAAMVLVGAIPTARLRLRLRPAFRFPPGVARRAGGLVTVGLIEVIVQQTSAVAVIALANGRGETGALVMFNYASQVFNSLNAVLALSIVLSAFPVLSARDGTVFDRTCAGSTRAVLLVACLGMALIGAVAIPAAQVLARQSDQVPQLIEGFALFAPGLVGAGVLANLTRALLAIGRAQGGLYRRGWQLTSGGSGADCAGRGCANEFRRRRACPRQLDRNGRRRCPDGDDHPAHPRQSRGGRRWQDGTDRSSRRNRQCRRWRFGLPRMADEPQAAGNCRRHLRGGSSGHRVRRCRLRTRQR